MINEEDRGSLKELKMKEPDGVPGMLQGTLALCSQQAVSTVHRGLNGRRFSSNSLQR